MKTSVYTKVLSSMRHKWHKLHKPNKLCDSSGLKMLLLPGLARKQPKQTPTATRAQQEVPKGKVQREFTWALLFNQSIRPLALVVKTSFSNKNSSSISVKSLAVFTLDIESSHVASTKIILFYATPTKPVNRGSIVIDLKRCPTYIVRK